MMPTFILFGGLMSPTKYWDNIWDKQIIDNDFIKSLAKIGSVYRVHIPYSDIYYYDKTDITNTKDFYRQPIDKLLFEDLFIDKFIKKIYQKLKDANFKAPYVLLAHSHGSYYAAEFSKQYVNECKLFVSLDGSWLSNKLLKERVNSWKKQKKEIIKIKDQNDLNELLNNIKTAENNNKYIKDFSNYIRYNHTKFALDSSFQQLKCPLIVFRDITITEEEKDFKDNNEWNVKAMLEDKILNKINNNIITTYWLVNATHLIWKREKYRKFILKIIISKVSLNLYCQN